MMAGATETANANVLEQTLKATQVEVFALYQKHISRYVKDR